MLIGTWTPATAGWYVEKLTCNKVIRMATVNYCHDALLHRCRRYPNPIKSCIIILFLIYIAIFEIVNLTEGH